MKPAASLVLACLISALLVACGGDGSSPAAESTPNLEARLAALAEESDSIVIGMIESSADAPSGSAGSSPGRDHQVRVTELLGGPLRASTITVHQNSPLAEPEFGRGATYVLFLKKVSGVERYEVTRGAEGRFSVAGDSVSSLSKAVPGFQLSDLGIDREPLESFKQTIRGLR